MEFGRVPNVDEVDFTLPKAKVPPGAIRRAPIGRPACVIRLGMSNWADPGLSKRLGGSVTPGGTVKHALRTYSLAMPTIELNSTFYGYSPERFGTWKDQVPAGFQFHPKLPRRITHEGGLGESDDEMARFVDATESLEGKRGVIWFALPPYIGPSEFRALSTFVGRWRPRTPLAVEVREPRWFQGHAFRNLHSMLADHDTAFIMTDTAGRRDALHMGLCSARTMIRFVANGLHPTDYTRLDEWAGVLAAWAAMGLQEADFFIHQTVEAQTVELAEHLDRRLVERGLGSLQAWRQGAGYAGRSEQLDLFGG